jgi:RNA polymerase primary sigma factor
MPRPCCSPTPHVSRNDDDTAAEEAAAALSALDAEGGRTTDPVRMYMREMGTVELLTREGEIAIAKRIEEGLNQVQASLSQFPWSIQMLLEEYELHTEGKRRLNEVVIGFLDWLAEADAAAAELAANPPPEPEESDEDDDDDDDDDDDTPANTGPDPAEVARRMDVLRTTTRSSSARTPSTARPTRRSSSCATRWPGVPEPEVADPADREPGAQAARGGRTIKDHERRVLELASRQARMPRKDFIRAWPATRPTSSGRRDDPPQAEVELGPEGRTTTRSSPSRRRLIAIEEALYLSCRRSRRSTARWPMARPRRARPRRKWSRPTCAW